VCGSPLWHSNQYLVWKHICAPTYIHTQLTQTHAHTWRLLLSCNTPPPPSSSSQYMRSAWERGHNEPDLCSTLFPGLLLGFWWFFKFPPLFMLSDEWKQTDLSHLEQQASKWLRELAESQHYCCNVAIMLFSLKENFPVCACVWSTRPSCSQLCMRTTL